MQGSPFWGLCSEEGEGACKNHVCLVFFLVHLCTKLQMGVRGGFKSQMRKNKLRLFKALLEHSRPSDSRDVRQ